MEYETVIEKTHAYKWRYKSEVQDIAAAEYLGCIVFGPLAQILTWWPRLSRKPVLLKARKTTMLVVCSRRRTWCIMRWQRSLNFLWERKQRTRGENAFQIFPPTQDIYQIHRTNKINFIFSNLSLQSEPTTRAELGVICDVSWHAFSWWRFSAVMVQEARMTDRLVARVLWKGLVSVRPGPTHSTETPRQHFQSWNLVPFAAKTLRPQLKEQFDNDSIASQPPLITQPEWRSTI